MPHEIISHLFNIETLHTEPLSELIDQLEPVAFVQFVSICLEYLFSRLSTHACIAYYQSPLLGRKFIRIDVHPRCDRQKLTVPCSLYKLT